MLELPRLRLFVDGSRRETLKCPRSSGVDGHHLFRPTISVPALSRQCRCPSRTSTVEQVQPKVRAHSRFVQFRVRHRLYTSHLFLCIHCAGCPFVDFHCGASMVKSSVQFPDSSGSRHRHRPCIPHLFLSFPGQDVPSRTSTVDANAVKRSRGFVESEQDTGCYSLIPKSSISEQNRENESSQKILWIRRF